MGSSAAWERFPRLALGALRHDTYVIANCNDEAMVNAMVRPDSPIMKTKGYNKSYPNVYGTPESVKGKTVLHDRFSAHFALSVSQVQGPRPDRKGRDHHKNMDQASALAAFEYGIGDIVTLWAPLTCRGRKRG